MRLERTRFQFGMELHADEPWMAFIFDDLWQYAVGRQSREAQALLLQPVLVGGIHFITMAVAFRDFGRAAIDRRDPTAAPQARGIGAKPHRSAEIAVLRSLFEFVAAQPFGHQTHDRFWRRTEFGGIGFRDADKIAGSLDHGHLHTETDAEIRHVALARELGRANFSLGTALAEAARNQDAVDVLEERRRIFVFEDLALDPVEVDLHFVGDTAMRQRFDQRLIRILHAGVFADDGNGHLP